MLLLILACAGQPDDTGGPVAADLPTYEQWVDGMAAAACAPCADPVACAEGVRMALEAVCSPWGWDARAEVVAECLAAPSDGQCHEADVASMADACGEACR